MSQHKYRAKSPSHGFVEIQAGWDRPMQWFYAVVSPVSPVEGCLDDPVYSNLDDPAAPTDDFSYFVDLIRERYGITLPDRMVEAVLRDCENNTANYHVYY